MKLTLVLLLTIAILLQIHWNVLIIKGLHQIAKNQVGSTKMIIEYLQVLLNKGDTNGIRPKDK